MRTRWVLLGITAALMLASANSVAASAHPADDAAVASKGCGRSAAPPGVAIEQFAADGKSGSYIRDLPAREGGQPMPVVLDLHGYLEPAIIEHIESQLGRFGADHGFVTITPELDQPGVPRWDYSANSADISYLSDLLSHVESNLCVDERRVYVTGLSMGAFTTSAAACRLADRVAAVAPVAGLQDYSWCHPSRPVPVVAFHGTADPVLAYTGGLGSMGRLLPAPGGMLGVETRSVPVQTDAWARHNGCGTDRVDRPIGNDVTLVGYRCPAGAEVELYAIRGGGHTWPGSTATLFPSAFVGATTRSISANQIMWDFFCAHPLPR